MVIFTNEVVYCAYTFILLVGALIAGLYDWGKPMFSRILGRKKAASQTVTMHRAEPSMAKVHGAFITIAGILNIGLAQIACADIEHGIRQFSFIITLAQTLAWAYLIYGNKWVRSLIVIGVEKTASIEKYEVTLRPPS